MEVLPRLAALVEGLRPGARALVAVDGPDAAGKTTLAGDLAARLARPCLTVSIDHWHHPRAVRLRRGDTSPDGYYLDSFDAVALVRTCLAPFAAGAPRVRTKAFDHARDAPVDDHADVPPGAVLLVEGVFLLRPELRDRWDLSTYLHVPEEVTLARAVVRDAHLLGSEEDVRRRYAQRYLPGQALYRQRAEPLAHADVVLDTSDPAEPRVLRWPLSDPSAPP